MKSHVRIGSLVIALLFAGWLTGCVNQPSYSGQRVRSARDFEIVETSTKRTLTTREMVHLKEKVEDYLEKEGITENGDYYVKIYLGEEDGVNEGEWVVVRYTREPAVRLNLVASYPNYYDPYRSTYAYDYYPFPHYGFGRLSFQYYDYPYYGYYHPGFRRPHHHGRGHHGDRDRKPDRDRDDDRDDDRDPSPNDGRPSGALKPSFKPSFVPANVNRNRGSGTAPAFDARVADNILRTRLDARPRSRNRVTDPAEPRPVPRGAPDFSARQPVTPANPGAFKPSRIRPMATVAQPSAPRYNRPEQQNTATVQRPANVRERQPAPASNASNRPVREVRTNTVSRPSPAAAFKPSAPRAQAAPAPVRSEPARSYSAPASRSESRSTSESTRASNHDDRSQEEQR